MLWKTCLMLNRSDHCNKSSAQPELSTAGIKNDRILACYDLLMMSDWAQSVSPEPGLFDHYLMKMHC
jgi:hypothetical protein